MSDRVWGAEEAQDHKSSEREKAGGQDGWWSGAANEPEDGWETAPLMETGRITTITLCRFTGLKYVDEACPARAVSHADVDCWEHYHSATALLQGDIVVDVVAGALEVRENGGDSSVVAL